MRCSQCSRPLSAHEEIRRGISGAICNRAPETNRPTVVLISAKNKIDRRCWLVIGDLGGKNTQVYIYQNENGRTADCLAPECAEKDYICRHVRIAAAADIERFGRYGQKASAAA